MITTIRQLAEMVATELNNAIKESECATFKEMKRLYDWEAADIKSEITTTAQMMLNNEWDALEEENGIEWMLENVSMKRPVIRDDGSIENFEEKAECTYGQFKKMVMENVM